MPLRFTILGDGPTDSSLKPIISWMLERQPSVARNGFVVEFTTGRGGDPAFANALASRIQRAQREFPCDLFFIHRDAEAEPPIKRLEEIAEAAAFVADLPPYVPAIPVRMTEAWLLIDEKAIKRAADNPNGLTDLHLPPPRKLEDIPDPKQICDDLLIAAAEKSGRRLQKFRRPSELAWRRVRLASLIGDFTPLMQVPAFKALFDATATTVEKLHL
jgi:hypothetical protein